MDSTNGEDGSTVSAKTKRERRTWPAELSVRLCRGCLLATIPVRAQKRRAYEYLGADN